jgi:hypothetical protein
MTSPFRWLFDRLLWWVLYLKHVPLTPEPGGRPAVTRLILWRSHKKGMPRHYKVKEIFWRFAEGIAHAGTKSW